MINLHESIVPGRDGTRDPWICSQTRICSQTEPPPPPPPPPLGEWLIYRNL